MTDEKSRRYCSELNPEESMAGTADHVGVWILLEYKPTWKAKALADSSLARATREWLDDNLGRLMDSGMRPRAQLIRQPEIDSDEVRLMVGSPGALRMFRGSGYGFLEDLDLRSILSQPATGEVISQPHYFVCTNGQRDVCCARYGLPAYAALRERVGERAWQVTHLGGHRFAPNVLVLPQGALYGRVNPDRVAALVDAVESGLLHFPELRGRSWYPKAVQAAEALLGRSGLQLLHVDGDERASRVTFAASSRDAGKGSPERLTVTVSQDPQGLDVLASCGDETLKRVYPYRLEQTG